MPISERSEKQQVAAIVGENTAGGDGVFGIGKGATGRGIVGTSESHNAVVGVSDGFDAVAGTSKAATGVFGASTTGRGVVGVSKSATGVEGNSTSGIGVVGKGGLLAGFFEGNVEVTGDIRLSNADCAEDFDVIDSLTAEPGTVMVLGDEGGLSPSSKAYDKRVAGVVSGAGSYKPGIVLDRQESDRVRRPIALLGKVYCKVDAQYGAIEVGDLLTTSPTLGHAMRADDPMKAFGTVIGKALRPFAEGKSMIPILIALQ
jgi:hypothetical protein